MTVPDQAAEYTYVFTLSRAGTPEDVAEMSFWAIPDPAITDWDPFLADQAEAAYNAWATHMHTDRWATNVQLTSVRARHFTPAGKTDHEQVFVPSPGWKGSSASGSMPWETSFCVSLYTYTPGGFILHPRRRRGRMYLPPMSSDQLDNSNSGYFLNSDVATFLGEIESWLQACQSDKLGGAGVQRPSVFSRVDSHLYQWTDVVIDAKFDSQRRRQNRESVGRVSTGIPISIP
jgi:hypothetical protein